MGQYDDLVTSRSSLRIYWPLNETSGTAATDLSGRGHTGTYSGGFTLNQAGTSGDDPGASVLFNGSTGICSVANHADFTFADSFTLEAWARKGTGTVTGKAIMGKGTNSWIMYEDTGSPVYELRKSGVGPIVTDQGIVDPTYLHHLMIVKNGTGYAKFYRDGVDVSSSPITAAAIADTSSAFTVANTPSGSSFWPGYISRVAAYNAPLNLSDAQASTIAGAGVLVGSLPSGLGMSLFGFSREIAPANPDRRRIIVTNDSDVSIYLSLGSAARVNQGIVLEPFGYWDSVTYRGAVAGIVNSGIPKMVCAAEET